MDNTALIIGAHGGFGLAVAGASNGAAGGGRPRRRDDQPHGPYDAIIAATA